MDHEIALINAFIVPAKRARHTDFLRNPKRRPKLLASLDHFHDLDPRYLFEIAPSDQRAETVTKLLANRGAPSQCHVISNNGALDGRALPLADALAEIVGTGLGSLVSCIPGRLGYFKGESTGDRFILDRRDQPPG